MRICSTVLVYRYHIPSMVDGSLNVGEGVTSDTVGHTDGDGVGTYVQVGGPVEIVGRSVGVYDGR